MLFAESEPGLAVQIVGGYMMFLLTSCLMGWFWLVQRRQKTGYFLPQQAASFTPIGLPELILFFFLWLASQAAGLKLAQFLCEFPEGPTDFGGLTAEQSTTMVFCVTSMQWVALALFIAWMKLGVRASWKDLGLSSDGLPRDIQIGVFAFLLITPPVMALQAALSSLYPEQKHPFIEAMDGDAGFRLMAAITFAAVITAPWFEELMFRVVALGWLERFFAGFSANVDTPSPDEDGFSEPRETFAELVELTEKTPAEASNPYAAPKASLEHDLKENLAREPSQVGWRPLPIVVSSFLFGAVHIGHGPAPIALFFFALGLGYVYQRTRRLLPCVIIHGLLNGQTTLMLFLLRDVEIPPSG